MTPTVVVVMGVSGVGKSTIGVALARHLGWTFLEADDDHHAQDGDQARLGELQAADGEERLELERVEARRGKGAACVDVAISASQQR